MENINGKEYLTVEQVCEIYKIGRNKAYSLIDTKKIEAFRLGKRWIVLQSSIESYIESLVKNNEGSENNDR